MVTKLFSMYPVSRNQNLDLAMEGYVEVLRSLPWRWVSVAIRALSEDPDLTFAPPVGKIRAETARQFRRAWRSQRGKDPDRDELGHPLALNDPDRWLLEARARAGLPILVDRPLVQRLEALVSRFEVE